MKKLILLFIAISLTGLTKKASAQAFDQGNIIVTAGYGWPNLVGAVFKAYENQAGYKASSVGPAYFKGEYGITKKLGLGINIAWANSKVTYALPGFDSLGNNVNYEAKINRSTFSVLARLNYHFGNSDKFDPYFGGGLGYRNATWKFSDNDPTTDITETIPNLVPFGFELTIGAHYYFTDNIGVYAELGFAKSPIQAGLSVKF